MKQVAVIRDFPEGPSRPKISYLELQLASQKEFIKYTREGALHSKIRGGLAR